MQRARLIAVTVGLAAFVAVMLPGVGTSSSNRAAQTCARDEFVSGLEVVLGHTNTEAKAEALQRLAVLRGFKNANIIPGCDFRVVVRGFETFDQAVGVQSEARTVHFTTATIECIQAKKIGRIEAIFGHGRDMASAEAIVAQAASFGYVGVKLRPDPCGGFEAYLAGFKDQAEANVFQAQAKDRGITVALEIN